MQKKRKKSTKQMLLLKITGELVKKERLSKNKGILSFAYEHELPNNTIFQLENGVRDPQFSTMWKIANALGYKFSDFIKLIEKELQRDFSLLDD